MIIETQIPSFLEWLLGPHWHQGTLVFWLIAAALAALAAAGVVVMVRNGAEHAARVAGRVLLVAAPVYLAFVGLLFWHAYLFRFVPETLSLIEQLVLKVGNLFAGPTGRLFGNLWLKGAIYQWLVIAALLLIVTVLLGWLVTAVRNGPVVAVRKVDRSLGTVIVEAARISPRRVWGLTRLAVKESIRSRVVVGFAVFLLLILFAGWFLDPTSIDPAKLYLTFVLSATSYLVLLLMLFVSSFSLPTDIRSKTLHTVVTKPVRSSEIVLGRMLGFTLVGTGLLLVMGSISYVFVVRGLNHTHQIDSAELAKARKAAAGDPRSELDLTTTNVFEHRHPVHVDADGTPSLGMENGHWHDIEAVEGKDGVAYEIGSQRGALLARVPVYGKLRFLDRKGQPAEKGVNVGDEWTYRSFIAGGSSAEAIWKFQGITRERFPEGLPVEMSFEVFRTYKGNIEKGVLGSLSVRNPNNPDVERFVTLFAAKDFTIRTQFIPLVLPGKVAGERRLDLFDDVVDEGELEIVLKCEAPAQFYGVAQPDLYVRAPDASFELNFVKGYVGIWLQMILVIGLGITFSTFLSGQVAMLATLGTLVLGFFSDFMYRLATGQTFGGGPVESAIRLVTQQNVVSEMEQGARTTMAKMVDVVFSAPLWVMSNILPPFAEFDCSSYVANGFDISPNLILTYTVRALGFLLPVFVAGYFFLKSREVAK